MTESPSALASKGSSQLSIGRTDETDNEGQTKRMPPSLRVAALAVRGVQRFQRLRDVHDLGTIVVESYANSRFGKLLPRLAHSAGWLVDVAPLLRRIQLPGQIGANTLQASDNPVLRNRYFQTAIAILVNGMCRGVGQVCFANNPWSGIIILLSLWLGSSAIYGSCLLVGLFTSTLVAWALQVPSTLIVDGIFGFNGVLVGKSIQHAPPRTTMALYTAARRRDA